MSVEAEEEALASDLANRVLQIKIRFNARGELYQAFARFDTHVLQPLLGGPTNPGGASIGDRDNVEMPSLQDFTELPGLSRQSLPDDEPTPAWSRSVIFE